MEGKCATKSTEQRGKERRSDEEEVRAVSPRDGSRSGNAGSGSAQGEQRDRRKHRRQRAGPGGQHHARRRDGAGEQYGERVQHQRGDHRCDGYRDFENGSAVHLAGRSQHGHPDAERQRADRHVEQRQRLHRPHRHETGGQFLHGRCGGGSSSLLRTSWSLADE